MANSSGLTAADYQAQIDQLFVQYEGRHATADELSALGAQLASGGRSLATVRADLVGSSAGQTYLAGAIGQLYQSWGGRGATAAEVAVWSNEMTIHGATLETVRQAVLHDPLGTGYTAAVVTQAYQAALGRAPTVGELAAWQDQFLAGFTQPAGVAAALGAGVQVATIDAQVTQAYQQWGGRDPTAGELATWRDTILNHGGTLDRLKADIIADPLGTTYLAAQVTQAYTQWMGRAPTAAELATWHGTFAGGGTLAQLKGDLLADAGVATYQAGQLAAYYASHGWVAPGADAAAALMTALRAGTSFADAAAALPHAVAAPAIDPAALAHIYDGYAAALGRAPTTAEATTAEATAAAATVLADGTGADALRATLLAGSDGQAHLAAQVTAAYTMLADRAPAAAELADWQGQLTAGTATLADLRVALIDSTDGHAHAGAVVAGLYALVLDRAPSATELQAGIDALTGGRSITGVGHELFTSAEGQMHFAGALDGLFTELMGRSPDATDTATWFAAAYDGADYAMIRAGLMLDPASTASHLTGTVGADTFALGTAPGDAVISAFDPAQDKVVVAAALAGTNLLDAAHAAQVMSLDGVTPNVLIKLDDHDTLLIHGVTLAQLSASDFQFG